MSSDLDDEDRRKQSPTAIGDRDILPAEPLAVRIKTAVELTGIGRSTLYRLINSGEIETVKIGRSTLIPYRCLKKLIGGKFQIGRAWCRERVGETVKI